MKRIQSVMLPVLVSITIIFSAVGGSTPAKASSTSDAVLQQIAHKLLPKLNRVALNFPGPMSTLDSRTNPYIGALKRVIQTYTLRHPRSDIRAAAALFVPPHGGYLLATNSSAHLDWLASDFVYGPSKVTSLAQSFSGKNETYQIFNAAMTIPASYSAAQYQGSLVVYTVTKGG
jgi:hypothetical protein